MTRKPLGLLLLVCAIAATAAGPAAEPAPPLPPLPLSELAPLGEPWLARNPYRGQPAARVVGRTAYQAACARCHGDQADARAMPAPDLRRLDRYCRGIAEPALRDHCYADNDAYYARSVREGKRILGVSHMPAWEGVLPQEAAWAIQVFIESVAAPVQQP